MTKTHLTITPYDHPMSGLNSDPTLCNRDGEVFVSVTNKGNEVTCTKCLALMRKLINK